MSPLRKLLPDLSSFFNIQNKYSEHIFSKSSFLSSKLNTILGLRGVSNYFVLNETYRTYNEKKLCKFPIQRLSLLFHTIVFDCNKNKFNSTSNKEAISNRMTIRG
jgi:hypothetical protein